LSVGGHRLAGFIFDVEAFIVVAVELPVSGSPFLRLAGRSADNERT